VDLHRRITYWNRGAERISEYAAEEVLGHSCSDGILAHVDEQGTSLCQTLCPLAKTLADGRYREVHVFLHHGGGARIPVAVRTAPRYGWPVGILFADLDDFKRVSDTDGPDVGDAVLTAVARTLRAATRGTDSVGRWGGDEFVAICPTADATALLEIAARTQVLLRATTVAVGGTEVRATVSIGGAMARSGDDAAALFARADDALYRSKVAGRDRVTVLDAADQVVPPDGVEGISPVSG